MAWSKWRTDKNVNIGDFVQAEGPCVFCDKIQSSKGVVSSASNQGFNLVGDNADTCPYTVQRWRLWQPPEHQVPIKKKLAKPLLVE